MVQSFTTPDDQPLVEPDGKGRRRVLVTGAAGNIGAYFAEHAKDKYDLRLMVREEGDAKDIRSFGEVVTADLSDLDRMKRLCRGCDAVLHLAADPSPSATWSDLLEANIVGAYHAMVAARAEGVRRFVYASSIHAVSGYPPDVQVKTSEPVNPGDLYGVTKCFGEALGRYMAEQEGMSTIAVRIGAFQPDSSAKAKDGVNMLDAWVSQRDLQQLLELCVEAEHVKFAVVHGVSDNRFKRLDLTDARELLGYRPQDDLTEVQPELKKLKLDERVASHSQSDAGQKSGIREEL